MNRLKDERILSEMNLVIALREKMITFAEFLDLCIKLQEDL